MAKTVADQNAAIARLTGDVANETTIDRAILTLVAGQADQIRTLADELAASNNPDTSATVDQLNALADSLEANATQMSAAVTANTPATPAPSDGTAPAPTAPANPINPDTAPMHSGGVAPSAHATSPAAPPATGPVNTNPAEPTNIGGGIGTAAGLSPVENLPAAMQPGDEAPTPVEPVTPTDGLDPTVRSPNPTATTATFPDADPAANHIDPATGDAVVMPAGVDPTTGAEIPRTDVMPVDVVRDETTDAPPPADVPLVDDTATDAPASSVSPPVIDPATGQPVQLDPVTNAPIVRPEDAPSDVSDATGGGPAPGPVVNPGAPII